MRVADFNTLDDLIAHAENELGATHVSVELVHGTGKAGPGTKLYFPRGGSYPYEEAKIWRKGAYWHAEGPRARTGVKELPSNAMTIERYLTRGGMRRPERRAAEEASASVQASAEQAGERYARDQIKSPEFKQWVRAQVYEASKMDPSQVLPLNTKEDARVVAEHTLQQFAWDTQRELGSFDILNMSGATQHNGYDVNDVLRSFYNGFDKGIGDPTIINSLADEILRMHQQIAAESGRVSTRALAERGAQRLKQQ